MTEKDKIVGKKLDTGKPRTELLLDMSRAMMMLAELLTYPVDQGTYEAHSWLNVENGEERYRGALLRHILGGAIDPIDPQFGLNHDVAVALNAMFVLELRLRREEREHRKKYPNTSKVWHDFIKELNNVE